MYDKLLLSTVIILPNYQTGQQVMIEMLMNETGGSSSDIFCIFCSLGLK